MVCAGWGGGESVEVEKKGEGWRRIGERRRKILWRMRGIESVCGYLGVEKWVESVTIFEE